MKRIVVLLGVCILSCSLLFSQFFGDGTLGNPYRGTITADQTWFPDNNPNDTIFAQSVIIASGVTLTISPGLFQGGHVQFISNSTLTINENAVLIIEPQISVTVYGIINNGTLLLASDSKEAGVASLIHERYIGNGSNQIQLYLPGGTTPGGDFKWHYIASPLNGIDVSIFNTLNLAQYIESLVVGPDNYAGWVAWDGYQYSSENTLNNTFETLELGRGYNYYSGASNTITLTGALNINDIELDITCGETYPDFQGYNLIGNPFASCIDWDKIIKEYKPEFLNDAIYITINGKIASYVGGIGNNGGTGTIPPLQGFFVKSTANSSIQLSTSVRVHNLDQMRYKKKSTGSYESDKDTISFFRLRLGNSLDSCDLVVRFNKKASDSFDKMFDAYEFSKTAGELNIWTTTGNASYSINGLPYPTTTADIPIGLNVKQAGSYKISSIELKKLDNYSVILKDLVTNETIDLKRGGIIEFDAPAGMNENRFIITITQTTTTIPDIPINDKRFEIFSSFGLINIVLLTNDLQNTKGSITFYDLAGRKLFRMDNIEWEGNGDSKQISNTIGRGIFIVEVQGGKVIYATRVYLQ